MELLHEPEMKSLIPLREMNGPEQGQPREPPIHPEDSLLSERARALSGMHVHFNCKSGRDRTGLMDSESTFMARPNEEKRSVPLPLPALPQYAKGLQEKPELDDEDPLSRT
jgi:hypothetical protein